MSTRDDALAAVIEGLTAERDAALAATAKLTEALQRIATVALWSGQADIARRALAPVHDLPGDGAA